MSIGAGIAIAGTWIFAGMALLSENISSEGKWLAIIIAASLTIYLS